MSETTPGETPVERRLREMAHCPYCTDGYQAPGLPCVICEQRITASETAAIDAGREALRLLRLLLPGVEIGEVCLSEYCQCGTLRAVREAQALLARCEETPR